MTWKPIFGSWCPSTIVDREETSDAILVYIEGVRCIDVLLFGTKNCHRLGVLLFDYQSQSACGFLEADMECSRFVKCALLYMSTDLSNFEHVFSGAHASLFWGMVFDWSPTAVLVQFSAWPANTTQKRKLNQRAQNTQ